jgi:hypothetical protein
VLRLPNFLGHAIEVTIYFLRLFTPHRYANQLVAEKKSHPNIFK